LIVWNWEWNKGGKNLWNIEGYGELREIIPTKVIFTIGIPPIDVILIGKLKYILLKRTAC